jgi:hypothetical protein
MHLAFPCPMMWTLHRANWTEFAWAGVLRPNNLRYLYADLEVGTWHGVPFGPPEPTCVKSQIPSVVWDFGAYQNHQQDNHVGYDGSYQMDLAPHPIASQLDWSCVSGYTTQAGRWKFIGDVSNVRQQWEMHMWLGAESQGHWDLYINYDDSNSHSAFLADVARRYEEVPWNNPVYYDIHHHEEHTWGFDEDGAVVHISSQTSTDESCVPKPADSPTSRTVHYDAEGRLDKVSVASVFRVRPLRKYRRKLQEFIDPAWSDVSCTSFSNQPTVRTLFTHPPILTSGTESTSAAERYLIEFGQQCPS